ncbi:MAG TPA: carboxypeptidase-like regulatory domain-containing protein [Vicinamibacterales bacterium]|nr:carboxypeptidase-like regulatory domain-containing protein [Vicinamibacterales bacterium]
MSRLAVFVALVVSSSVVVDAGQQRAGGPPPPGTAFLAGQVVEAGAGKPIPGARVAIFSNRGVRPEAVVADSQGRFFFANLPAGTYSMDAAMPGYQAAVAASGRAIPLADGERVTSARIRLVRLAVVSGTVRDQAGDPATGTEVVALRRGIVNGRPELVRSGQTRADDRGAYRIGGLRPGEYIVCACARDVIPFDGVLLTTIASQPAQLLTLAARAIKQGADVAGLDDTLRTYPPTFYPNSTTIAQAERVAVTAGEERSGIDVSVAAVRAARVSGAITGATGPTTAAWIRLVPAGEGGDSAAIGAIPPMLVQPDGRFDFAGVPPGQYVLKIRHLPVPEGAFGPSGAALALAGNRGAGPAPPTRIVEGTPYWAEESITVSGADVRGLSVLLRPGPRLSGRLEFVGNQAPPAPEVLVKSGVAFTSVGPTPEFGVARVAADARFVVDGALPGSYVVSPRMTVSGWTVKSVTVGGVDATDLPIDVASRDVTDIVITYSDAPPAMLTGTVAGQPVPLTDDLTALIFSADRRYWAAPAAAARRFRAVAISPPGAFAVAGLAPGDYFVVAVPDEASVDWQDPRRLDVLARTAERVALPEGGKVTVTLRR